LRRVPSWTPSPCASQASITIPLLAGLLDAVAPRRPHWVTATHAEVSLVRIGGLCPCDTGDRPRARRSHNHPLQQAPRRVAAPLRRAARRSGACLPPSRGHDDGTPISLRASTPTQNMSPFDIVPAVPVAPCRSRVPVALLRLVTPRRIECDGLQRVSIPTAGVSAWSAHAECFALPPRLPQAPSRVDPVGRPGR